MSTQDEEINLCSLLENVLEKYDHETEEQKQEHLKKFCSNRTKEELRKTILEIAELVLDDPEERIKLADAIINSGQLADIFNPKEIV